MEPDWSVIGWGIAKIVGGIGILVIVLSAFATIRPVERGLIERFGKYHRFAGPGLHWLIPLVDSLVRVNITEQMVSSEKREIITKDKLNAMVDSQVYFRVKATEDGVKASQYAVQDYPVQIVALAKTTLRNIIGNLTLTEANSDRKKINDALAAHLTKETASWGIEIVRTELKEIDPPKDVQESMNNVVKAENQKVAAKDFAIATETKADGERMAAIKVAEGEKQAAILRAEGEAAAIKVVNEAAERYFVGNAQTLRKLEAVEKSLSGNTKVVLPGGSQLVNVIGDLAGLTNGHG